MKTEQGCGDSLVLSRVDTRGEQGSAVTLADDPIDPLKRSLQNCLDASVVAIAHFTEKTSGAGFAPEPCSVAHALNTARDHETTAHHTKSSAPWALRPAS